MAGVGRQQRRRFRRDGVRTAGADIRPSQRIIYDGLVAEVAALLGRTDGATRPPGKRPVRTRGRTTRTGRRWTLAGDDVPCTLGGLTLLLKCLYSSMSFYPHFWAHFLQSAAADWDV